MSRGPLVSEGHALELVEESSPVVREHLRVLDPLLRPVLVPPADLILRLLEVDQLVPKALLDEHGPVVLVDDRLLVLQRCRPVSIQNEEKKEKITWVSDQRREK